MSRACGGSSVVSRACPGAGRMLRAWPGCAGHVRLRNPCVACVVSLVTLPSRRIACFAARRRNRYHATRRAQPHSPCLHPHRPARGRRADFNRPSTTVAHSRHTLDLGWLELLSAFGANCVAPTPCDWGGWGGHGCPERAAITMRCSLHVRRGKSSPATRNRARGHLFAAAYCSQMRYQPSYSRPASKSQT